MILYVLTCAGVAIGVVTGAVGLYRFRTVRARVHVCSAAATWITWTLVIFCLVYSKDLWIRCALVVYWLVRVWLAPLGSQVWLFLETNRNADRNTNSDN